MFHAYADLSRRTRVQGPSRKQRPANTRRLTVESLEPRQMLSASHGSLLPHGDAFDGDGYPTEGAPADGSASNAAAAGALHPLTAIPVLHSNPSARVKLYLDFDGHFQAAWGNYTNITTPVYDRDGDPTTFNDEELGRINIAWHKMAEDFAPYNVDVTTEEPPELAAGTPESAANGVALRIAVGGTSSWTGGNYGGLALHDAFTNSAPNVVYVFKGTTDLYLGDTASHEAGHALGLRHQSSYDAGGGLVNEYNQGTATWAPVMGYTFRSITTWYNGTTTSATTFQDEMAVLANSINGFGYRADDHANAPASATPLNQAGPAWSGSGIIETNSDVDAFSFTVAAESLYRMAVDVAAIGPNLDAVLQLRNATGQILASAASFDSQATEIVRSLVPGGYILSVLKSAVYGWVGQYSVNVAVPEAAVVVAPAAYPLTTTEAGGASSFSVVLSTAPTADVVIPVSSSKTTEGVASAASLIFTPVNWNVPQPVTVTGVDDGLTDGDAEYFIVVGLATSGDPRFHGLNPSDVSVVNADNDVVKFHVVNDATANSNYKYDAAGQSLGTSTLTSANSTPRGVANTAAGDKTWVVDANRKVYIYRTSDGALLGSWTAGTMASNATPEGIATDGTDVWIVDAKSDKVYRYAGAAGRLSGSQNAASSFALNSGNKDPKDIATDGASLWVVNDSSIDKVFKYSMTGSLVGSWTISTSGATSPTGITLDPGNVSDLWIVDNGTDRVYQYAAAAGRTSGSQNAVASFTLSSSNSNPQGIAVAINIAALLLVATRTTADPNLFQPSAPARSMGEFLFVSSPPIADRQPSASLLNSDAVAGALATPASSYSLQVREQVFSTLGEKFDVPPMKRSWLGATPRKATTGRMALATPDVQGPLSDRALDVALALGGRLRSAAGHQ